MAKPAENTPLSELIGGLLRDVTGLLRKEIDLAKTEASEKLSNALSGIEILLIGLVMAIGAVGVLLSAIVSGVAAVLVAQGFVEPTANALASIIVGAVIGIIAWIMIARGLAVFRRNNLTLQRTTTSLGRDVQTVKDKL
ncbi:nutrient deprivation-induced protein [Rhizobium leguminosarum bv. trifolii]|uniref:Nutrient deprivation-induced protein n=1 Tax=Rhizobium leguminosarum bv. trifolii TaxID=386 RepID=A0A3E1B4Y4_RHILT|nr:phage holin family protein [Rhizobium leguminosarum]RFB85484.1 nutrient deprivation-induced protein [Rhizobium leguminosarum bv. trifolii]RFB85610.1 nutrient deprivation-induced protein [Rhizobium leguminosarum bv. trifolii]